MGFSIDYIFIPYFNTSDNLKQLMITEVIVIMYLAFTVFGIDIYFG